MVTEARESVTDTEARESVTVTEARQRGRAVSWAAGQGRRARHWAKHDYRRPGPAQAGASVACAAAAGAWAVAVRSSLAGPLVVMCATGVLCVVAGVLSRRTSVVLVGESLVAGTYLATQVGRPITVAVPAALGVLLFASAELAWWSAELSTRTSWAAGTTGRRWSGLVALAAAGFVVAVTAGMAGVSGLGSGGAVLLVGAACALLLGLLLARTARAAAQR